MNSLTYGEVIGNQFFFGKVYPSHGVENDEESLFASKDFFTHIGLSPEKIKVMFKPLVEEKEEWYKCYLRSSNMQYQLLLTYDELAGLQLKNIFYASLDWYFEYSLHPLPLYLILKIPAEHLLISKKFKNRKTKYKYASKFVS